MGRRTRLLALSLAALLVVACGTSTPSTSGASASAPTTAPSAGTPAPVDPATALRIADPWTLDDEFPEVRQQVLDGLEQQGFPDAKVRHVTGPDGESAFLMAADAGLTADTDLEDYARRLSETSLTGAAIEQLGDEEIAILQTDAVTIVAWVEPPLLLAAYAADPATARRIAGAVIGSP